MTRQQRGMALAELLVAATIAALVMASLAGVLFNMQQTDTQLSGRALLQRDARLALGTGPLAAGFVLPEAGFAVVTESELYAATARTRTRSAGSG